MNKEYTSSAIGLKGLLFVNILFVVFSCFGEALIPEMILYKYLLLPFSCYGIFVIGFKVSYKIIQKEDNTLTFKSLLYSKTIRISDVRNVEILGRTIRFYHTNGVIWMARTFYGLNELIEYINQHKAQKKIDNPPYKETVGNSPRQETVGNFNDIEYRFNSTYNTRMSAQYVLASAFIVAGLLGIIFEPSDIPFKLIFSLFGAAFIYFPLKYSINRIIIRNGYELVFKSVLKESTYPINDLVSIKIFLGYIIFKFTNKTIQMGNYLNKSYEIVSALKEINPSIKFEEQNTLF